MLKRKMQDASIAMIAAALVGTAAAGGITTIDIGGGWEASFDDSLVVDVVGDGDSEAFDVVFIEKSAQFFTNDAIAITFTRTSANARGFIAIDDEIITNSTGVDWTGFQMSVTGGAVFDPTMTLAAGGSSSIGFTVAPFTTAAFAGGNTQVDMGGGTIANGATWLPGGGATNGQLWIDASSIGVGESFTLWETPEIPGPAAIAGLALGIFARRRRRG